MQNAEIEGTTMMNVNPLQPSFINLVSNEPASPFSNVNEDTTVEDFAKILSDSLKTAGELDAADKASAIELLIGKSDDLSGLLLDAQKAEMSLTLALQIRNKVLDAYNEIMRMQV